MMADGSNIISTAADAATVATGIVALVVGYVSIRLSGEALAVQERHNKLSVRPIPFAGFADYENELRVKITNDGAGPLIIKRVSVTDNVQTKNDLISLMPSLPEGIYWTTFTSLLTDRAILPTTELILMHLKGDPKNSEFCGFRDQCRSRLAPLTVTVEYTDIYDTKFPPYSRALDWFARNKGTPSIVL